jgi:type 1 glutamine amidotransferase
MVSGGASLDMRSILLVVAVAAAAAVPVLSQGSQRIPVMILDGESGGPYHDWQRVTAVLKKTLDETGLFDTTVVTVTPATDFGSFDPPFAQHRAIVMNYDAPDERWPAALKASFEQYVRSGGGLVAVHAADNAFPGWAAFNEMVGVGGWRGRTETAGPYWFFRDGRPVSDTAPGRAGSHGRRVPFQVTVRDAAHPITKGLPRRWMHQGDELYARMRGPGRNMTVLATAYSDPQNAGSGRDEPMLMAIDFGQGRVFHMTFGHDVFALSSVDSIVLLQRGTEWAATGRVTQNVPPTFPTADTVSYRADVAAMDPAYQSGLDGLTTPNR